MKHFFLIPLILLSLCLSGCREEISTSEQDKAPAGYLELLEAYEEGLSFSSAEHVSQGCVLTFGDGSRITVPETSFIIDDCTGKDPVICRVTSGWWSKDGLVLGIKADSSLSREEALPVYVYFDEMTLYMKLSNYECLTFPSVALEEEMDRLEKLERMQNLPVIRIKTDGNAQILDKKNYVKGSITISDPEGLYGDTEDFTARMGIRGRGNSTWEWPKKPWKVKLDKKASLLGMPADKEWALLANYSDRTLMRNIVALKISEICGFN